MPGPASIQVSARHSRWDGTGTLVRRLGGKVARRGQVNLKSLSAAGEQNIQFNSTLLSLHIAMYNETRIGPRQNMALYLSGSGLSVRSVSCVSASTPSQKGLGSISDVPCSVTR